QVELGYARSIQLANCIFAAAPGHAFLGELMARVASYVDHAPMEGIHDGNVEDSTGPRMLTRCFEGRSPSGGIPFACCLRSYDGAARVSARAALRTSHPRAPPLLGHVEDEPRPDDALAAVDRAQQDPSAVAEARDLAGCSKSHLMSLDDVHAAIS